MGFERGGGAASEHRPEGGGANVGDVMGRMVTRGLRHAVQPFGARQGGGMGSWGMGFGWGVSVILTDSLMAPVAVSCFCGRVEGGAVTSQLGSCPVVDCLSATASCSHISACVVFPLLLQVPLNLLASAHFATNPALAFHQAMVATNLQCHRCEKGAGQDGGMTLDTGGGGGVCGDQPRWV